VYLAVGATDLRKGFDGLYGLARDSLGLEPLSGHLALFCNRQRTRLKILFWDGSGLWVCARRLEKGRYSWPSVREAASACVTLSHEEFSLLIGGLDSEPNPPQKLVSKSGLKRRKKPRKGCSKHVFFVSYEGELSDPFPPPETLDALLREQLAAALPEPLWQKLNGSLQRDQQRLRSTEERLRLAEYKVRLLEARLRLIRINKYGPGSEKLSDAQLALLEVEPGVSIAEVAAESHREPLIAPRPAKPARPHPGRQQLPAHLPRVERLIACTPEQCICGQCGRPTTFIGYEQSEQLDVEPAKYGVVVTKREKRACQSCEEHGVACAPLPARIIEKGLASDRVVIDAVVRKYADYLPLYRQSVILERETGLSISRATLDGWVMQVGDLLRPIVGAMRQELLSGCYLQADETTVGVQMHDGRGQNHQAYLWQYGQPRGSVVFDFRLGRERDSAQALPGRLRRPAAKRRLRGLRSGGRPGPGARGLLGARPAQVLRRGQTECPGRDRH
jgi:transposase